MRDARARVEAAIRSNFVTGRRALIESVPQGASAMQVFGGPRYKCSGAPVSGGSLKRSLDRHDTRVCWAGKELLGAA